MPAAPSDPSLVEQLRPLPTAELLRRVALLGDAAGGRTREEALAAAVAAYQRVPRVERHCCGAALPEALTAALLRELRELRWPSRHGRPGVSSAEYLVLQNTRDCGTRHPHYELRKLCAQLLALADPEYEHTAIAVTKCARSPPRTRRAVVLTRASRATAAAAS